MTANRRFTDNPFTVAVCMACAAEPASVAMAKLRETVANCPHGVLVATQCLLGQFTCATTGSERGVMLLVQPCTVQRVPTASVQWIGPVRTEAEAAAACRWIAAGDWSRESLPLGLRADLNLARPSRQN